MSLAFRCDHCGQFDSGVPTGDCTYELPPGWYERSDLIGNPDVDREYCSWKCLVNDHNAQFGIVLPTRPSFERTFLDLAEVWSRRATCDRLHTGCVIADDEHQVLVSGYNGSPRGLPHCDEEGHEIEGGHCVRTLHAEENAILQAARIGVTIRGASAYVLHRPCYRCALRLMQAGIKRVVYRQPYEVHGDIDRVAEACRQGGMELRHFTG